MDPLNMSLNSSSEFDSPNTKEKKKFKVVGGVVTKEEWSFLVRNRYLEEDSQGEFKEVSTIIDTEEETDEEDENLDPGQVKIGALVTGKKENSPSSIKSAVEDSLGILCQNMPGTPDWKRSFRVLSPLAVNSVVSADLVRMKEVDCWEKDQTKSICSDGQSDIIKKTDTTASSFTVECDNTRSDVLKEINNGESSQNSVSSQGVVAVESEAGHPASEGIDGVDAPIPLTGYSSFNCETAIHPRASPSSQLIDLSSPSCSEIEMTRRGILCMETPAPRTATNISRASNNSYNSSTPAVGEPARFLFSPDDDGNENLMNIQWVSEYSSPLDINTEKGRNLTLHSPVVREYVDKPVELTDISYGDVADVIAANESDASVSISSRMCEKSEGLPAEPTLELLESEVAPSEMVKSEGSRAAKSTSIELEPESTQPLDEESTTDELVSSSESKGIDAVSPATVPGDISLSDTTSDSFAEVSLDDVSAGSFNIGDVADERELDEIQTGGPNDSFRSCSSTVSHESFTSCKQTDISILDEERSISEARSIDDLDDTITIMEKLLQRADELENHEKQQTASKSPFQGLTSPTSIVHVSSSMTADTPIFATPKSPSVRLGEANSLFATPMLPAPRSKTVVSVSKMTSQYFSPKTQPRRRSPVYTSTSPRSSPRELPSSVKIYSPKSESSKSPSSAQSITSPRRRQIHTILDSPQQIDVLPKVGVTKKGTPGRKTTALNHPIVSPVANYIYSLPPPVPVQRMIPPPKTQISPKKTIESRIPQPKLTMPRGSDNFDSRVGAVNNRKPGRETINSLLPEKRQGKELACNVNYVGPDSVKAVNSSFSTPTSSKLPMSVCGQGITPVTDRHLGMRDSNNSSMITQNHATRQYCPERFGYRSNSSTPKTGK